MSAINKPMLLSVICLVTLGQWYVSGQAGSPSTPFTLTISVNPVNHSREDTNDKTIRGSGLIVRIRKTNITDQEIPKLGSESGPFGYIFDVRDSEGNPAPPHESTGQLPVSGGYAPIIGTKDVVLQPKESKTDYAPLSEWYELSKPGTYTIQVSQHVSSDPNSAVVKSNKVTVTIAP